MNRVLPFLSLVSLATTVASFSLLPARNAMTESSVQRRRLITCFEGSEGMSVEDKQVAMDKATKAMTAFTNKYLQNTGTTLCADKSVAAVVIRGLAEHKVTLGAPLCPCRYYQDKPAEAKSGYWNCPCVPMREVRSAFIIEARSSFESILIFCSLVPSQCNGKQYLRIRQTKQRHECHCMLFLTEDNAFAGQEQVRFLW